MPNSDAIDRTLLPREALFDTGVFMRAIGERTDERSTICENLFSAMIDAGARVYVAAPSIGEIIRHKGKPIPRHPAVEPLAFDEQCARVMGDKLPMDILIEVRDSAAPPLVLNYVKYDALIVATASRWSVAPLVTLDKRGMTRLAGIAGVLVKSPFDYRAKQPHLPAVT
jgi:predicted nucleic acid-binding protein